MSDKPSRTRSSRRPPVHEPGEGTASPERQPGSEAAGRAAPAAAPGQAGTAETPASVPGGSAPAKRRRSDFNRPRPRRTAAAPKPAATARKPAARKAPAAPSRTEQAETAEGETESLEGEVEPGEIEIAEDGHLAELPVDAEGEAGDEGGATVPASRALAPAAPTALAPTDLLQRYMAEVNRHPLLSREEENAIARKFVETQDPSLAYRLVTANLRLVVKIAWEYRRAAFNLLDLIQEGNVGLMQAVRKYDPTRGVKLSTYAAWWIRAYIIRYLMDNWRMVKLGTTQAQRKIFFNLRKEKEKLAARGFEPEPKLLAERLNVSEQDVVEMDRRLSNDEFSLDAPLSDESGASFVDRLAQGGEAVDERLADSQLGRIFHEKLGDFSRHLADKERFIFEKRLTAEEPMTLQEVGDHYGISRERARQIEARLVARLRDYMKEHLPDYAQLSLRTEED